MKSVELYPKLREILSQPLPGEEAQFRMAPVGRRAAFLNPEKPPRLAAVLVPIYYDREGEPHILLTLRKVYDGVHSGQVSFPGGKFDQGETDPVMVALRETFEEVGVSPELVQVAGKMSPLYIPPSNIIVHPVVGIIEGEPVWHPDPHEVEQLIHTPLLPWLSARQIAETAHRVAPGLSISAPYYDIQNHRVWGATAMMLSEFAEIMQRVGWV